MMKIRCAWSEKMKFTAESDRHLVVMDTKPPIGDDRGFSPKQLVIAGICGCTAMDVVSLLKKYRQPIESFQVEAEASLTEKGHPVVFKEVHLVFKLKGAINTSKLLEAVRLSQTRYCGVSAMISRTTPISYTVELNGREIGTGQADFQKSDIGWRRPSKDERVSA